MPGSTISSAIFTRSNQHLITRGMDDTLKLFDIRNFKKPVKVVSDLANFFESTNTIFSPDQRYILTGTSVKKNQGIGKIKFFDTLSLDHVRDIDFGNTSVVHLNWHTRTNQIFAGLSDGNIQVMYNPSTSIGGIQIPLAKQVRRRAIDQIDYSTEPIEIEPPREKVMFDEEIQFELEEYRKKSLETVTDKRDLRKPTLPITVMEGAGKNGKLGISSTATLLKTLIKKTDHNINVDPREAILKYAKEAESDPYWVAPAYKKNQPVPLYNAQVDPEILAREAKKRRLQ